MFIGGNDLGRLILDFRICQKTEIPSRLKKLFSWNLSSWKRPKAPVDDPKMRRVKKLLKRGPVLLQETKWSHAQPGILAQYLAGTKIASAPAITTEMDEPSGGVAILWPPDSRGCAHLS